MVAEATAEGRALCACGRDIIGVRGRCKAQRRGAWACVHAQGSYKTKRGKKSEVEEGVAMSGCPKLRLRRSVSKCSE